VQKEQSLSGLMISLDEKPVIVEAGMNVHGRKADEAFVMDGTWSLHLYRWTGSLSFSGSDYPITPGTISLAPPFRRLKWHFPLKPCVHFFVHFRTGTSPGKMTQVFPVVQNAGIRFEELWNEMEKICSLHKTHPLRADIRFWDLLLDLADRGKQNQKSKTINLPSALETAVIIIQNEIREPLRIGKLATRVGVSRNHLIALFQKYFKMSPITYLHTRRLEKATRLLKVHTIPVQTVAEEIGIPSLQQFNKFLRAKTGMSPRAFRQHT